MTTARQRLFAALDTVEGLGAEEAEAMVRALEAEARLGGMPLDARVRTVAATKCALDLASDNLSLLISDAVHAGRGTTEATTRLADVLADLRPVLQKLRTVSALLPHERTVYEPPAVTRRERLVAQ